VSLLEDAMKAERTPKVDDVTPEQMEMAIAWAEGVVSTNACARASNKKTTTMLVLFARYLQAAVREGVLKRSNKVAKIS
jgi:hypothetical protein